jgi:hypothetical protein
MKYRNSIIAYNAGGPITVCPSPDKTHWADKYDCIIDAQRVARLTRSEQTLQLLYEFVCAVVLDRVPVDQAHQAYCCIDEYRALMTDGARGDDVEKQH